ncbi:isoaspartyl peptidase/L-asparaginase, partial [uncultured Planktosalinus sp.]|uniref:isoaspartyl peptidase/L-asparaginase n=1 Tax=uncultured Planktosalinus sp. TaxID=1810935 RepID=UPI0030DDA0DA
MKKYTIAIHGGAGTLVKGLMTPEKEKEYKNALEKALQLGFSLLEQGASALDVVEQAVRCL